METLKKFGIIGKDISYSFSKKYFENKFRNLLLKDHSYEIFDIDNISKVKKILEIPNLVGLNVTIPYKEKVISHLDKLSHEAKKTGAVNCILINNGIKEGFNTDVYGFEKTLLLHKKDFHHSALILGDGGAAKAVKYVMEKYRIPYKTVSRNSDLNFNNLTGETVAENPLIIQCTPIGTFPNVDECLNFPFDNISEKHLIIDLIYNPNRTKFIKNASKKGAKTVNGFYMLEKQAEKNWEIWNFQKK
jgi:shikimate dehydrogenase